MSLKINTGFKNKSNINVCYKKNGKKIEICWKAILLWLIGLCRVWYRVHRRVILQFNQSPEMKMLDKYQTVELLETLIIGGSELVDLHNLEPSNVTHGNKSMKNGLNV